jgi:glycosyltransferase involved in cell wall biosynthesis
MNPLVSIIIPTYNRAHLVRETLDSVQIQTYENWECIIVDDGSIDETLKMIKKYELKNKKFKIYSRPASKNKGANSCRNYGVEQSNGEYLIFLDSDDILKNDCVQGRIETFKTLPFLDFVVFSMGLIKKSNFENYIYPDLSIANRDTLISLFITGPLPWNMTRPIWKKDFFCEQGLFNEKLNLFDDDEFNLRVVYNKKIKFKFIDITDCFYRIYEENSLKYKDEVFLEKLFKSHLQLLEVLNKMFDSNDKIKFKKELQQNIFGIISEFVVDKNVFKKHFKANILFFFKNFESSLGFNFFLLLKCLSLTYPSDMKGGYRINKFIDSKIKYFIRKW